MQPNEIGNSAAAMAGGEPQSTGRVADHLPLALWLLLGLVIEKPSHGYEIDQRYSRRFGSFLPLSTSRIYDGLTRLRGKDLIEPIRLESEKPSRRQHRLRRSFRATAVGAQAYRHWVAERMRDDPRRAELLGRVAGTGLLGVDAVLEMVDRYERESMQELMALPSGAPEVESGSCSLSDLTNALIVDQQRRHLQADRDWAVYARQALEAYKRRVDAQGTGA